MRLGERERYVLWYALDHVGGSFEAQEIAALEFRTAQNSGDEELVEKYRRGNRAIGWGRTLTRLAEYGLIERRLYEGVGRYTLPAWMADQVRELLAEPNRNTPAGGGVE